MMETRLLLMFQVIILTRDGAKMEDQNLVAKKYHSSHLTVDYSGCRQDDDEESRNVNEVTYSMYSTLPKHTNENRMSRLFCRTEILNPCGLQ